MKYLSIWDYVLKTYPCCIAEQDFFLKVDSIICDGHSMVSDSWVMTVNASTNTAFVF